MKCTSKVISFILICGMLSTFSAGCGKQQLSDAYDIYDTSAQYGLTSVNSESSVVPFAGDLCIADSENSDGGQMHTQVAEGAALFNTADSTTGYAQNIYKRMYPASTTKILTAYIALKYGDLDQMVTVSADALNGLDPSSSVCGVKAGDQLTLRQLLYGLLLCSGNDAAEVIAETISGSTEQFADLMNQEAQSLGAVDSHFVNPHGLPDDQHYTTVYDMYLIFNAAIKDSRFREIISTKQYQAVYHDASGNEVRQTWKNTNKYLTGEKQTPDGVTVIGGKTGTTNAAGYCLVLLSENEKKEPIISIVMKADGRSDLYLLMSEMLTNFSNES